MSLFERELLKRLDSYKAEGLIDARSESNLRKALEAKAGASARASREALYIVGAILVFTAFAVWVCHNWAAFGERLQEALAFVPLAISAVLGVFAIKKDLPQAWKEAAAFLNVAGVAAMIYAISRIYNIQGDTARFCLAVICLSAPAALIFRSGAAIAAICVLNAAFSAACPEPELALGIGIYAAAAFIAYSHLKTGGVFRNAVMVFVCLCSTVSISYAASYEGRGTVLAAGFAGVFLAASATKRLSQSPLSGNPFALSGFLILLWAVYMGASRYALKSLSEPAAAEAPAAFYPAFWTLCALYLFSLFRAFRNQRRVNALLAASAVFPAFAAAMFSGSFWISAAVVNATAFFGAAAMFAGGISANSRILSNAGVAVILLQCAARAFESQADAGIRAAAFAAAGLLLMAFNFYLNRRKSDAR